MSKGRTITGENGAARGSSKQVILEEVGLHRGRFNQTLRGTTGIQTAGEQYMSHHFARSSVSHAHMNEKQVTVYVIDDDESVRTALARLLRSADFKAETFSSGEEFLSHPSLGQKACMLVDIRMPGLTAFDLQQELASRGIKIPAIVISASDDELVREHARQLGAVAFLRKPVDDRPLLDAVLCAVAGTP